LAFRAFCEQIGRQGSSAMRSLCALLTALLYIAVIGCTTVSPRSKSMFGGLSPFRGPTGSDVVQLEWGLIERPVGDHYLNEDLWALANEQVIPLERKDELETNGLRIASIGGLLPAEFLELVRSERNNPSPQRKQVRSGHPTVLALGPIREKCSLAWQPGVYILEGFWPGFLCNAQLGIAVTPSLADDNKVHLSFTPQIEHGELKMSIRPTADGSGWTNTPQRITDKYGALSWDVTLAANDYLVVGCWFKSANCFGKEAFVRVDEPRPVQRLLVIRAARQVMEIAGSESNEENVPPRTVAAIARVSPR
jgi:hypothetical protein